MHNRKRFFWEVITLIIWIILTTLAWSLPVGWTKLWQMSIFWTSNSEWPTTDKSCGESIIRDGYRVKYMKFGFSYVIKILDSLSITKYILSTVYVSCWSFRIWRPKFVLEDPKLNFWLLTATSLVESTWTGLMHQILKYVYENEHQLDRSKENNGKVYL